LLALPAEIAPNAAYSSAASVVHSIKPLGSAALTTLSVNSVASSPADNARP